MTLPTDFLESLRPIHSQDILKRFSPATRPSESAHLVIVNELKPADLFCYLGARFGRPNGLQNILRADHSDNLIHWEWALDYRGGTVLFQGMNFRSEIWIFGVPGIRDTEKAAVVAAIKADYAAHGPKMSEVRRSLEHWTEFVNPYQRIRRAIRKLSEDLDSLNLDPDKDALQDFWKLENLEEAKSAWTSAAERYSKGFGICFGIRSMLPVLAEAFINLLMYVLLRPDLRDDDRLRENAFRQPIDVRVKSLPINCHGFTKPVDYASDPCRAYHSLVNERNDLLHGNVVIEKLKFNELYFWGKVPVFQEYHSLWERSIGVEQRAVGLSAVDAEQKVVDDFIEYVLSLLEEKLRENVEFMLDRYELGLNSENGRLGVLFPEWLVDFKVGFKAADASESK